MHSRFRQYVSVVFLLFLAAAVIYLFLTWQPGLRESYLLFQPTNSSTLRVPQNQDHPGQMPQDVSSLNSSSPDASHAQNNLPGEGIPALTHSSPTLHVYEGNELWVGAQTGAQNNHSLKTGSSPSEALPTIQDAANIAQPGTVIRILPGMYREPVIPQNSGSKDDPIVYVAAEGPGTVTVRGSEPSSSLVWTRIEGNTIGLPPGADLNSIYFTDLSAWGLDAAPRFIAQMSSSGEILSKLLPAREPDWQVETEWKAHEFWWFANGGSSKANCDPTTNPDPHCDLPWRSYTQLTDTSSDTEPSGVEPGNLTSLGNLTGALLIALDAHHAHYTYHATIISHNVSAGRITVDEQCESDGTPGLGWGSKYYLENHPALMDLPGEWWYDASTGRLYLWSPTGANPALLNLEISRWENGFDLTNRSNVVLDGFTIELYNGEAYKIDNKNPTHKAHNNVVRNVSLRYADYGIELYQYVNEDSASDSAVDGFLLENSEISHMDTAALETTFWWPDAPAPAKFRYAGVRNTIIRNNAFHDLGFDSDARSAVGIRVFFPDHFRFENNHIYQVAQNGIHFHLSLVDTPKEYGFKAQEIKLGEILVKDNLFEKVCQLASDCGALKFGGSDRPYTHVFRDVLVVGNVFRDSFGWSFVSVKRGLNTVGDANGLYIDYASGIHAYRNIAYNNTGAGFKLACLWRDGDIIFYNNIAANNYAQGVKFTGGSSYCDSHNGSVNTQLANNILVNNDGYAIQFVSGYENNTYGNLTIDHNLYDHNSWNNEANWGRPADIALYQGSKPAQYYQNLPEIQAGTPWEDHGVEGDSGFYSYSVTDHNRYDGSWPDFHIMGGSNTLDRGTVELPSSLKSLLTRFGVVDVAFGSAYDIGRYETPGVIAKPTSFHLQPGGSVEFLLSIFPPDFPDPLGISISNAPSDLRIELESTTLEPGAVTGLMVTDTHDPDVELLPGLWYTIVLIATYQERAQNTYLNLLVGGSTIYLPLIAKNLP